MRRMYSAGLLDRRSQMIDAWRCDRRDIGVADLWIDKSLKPVLKPRHVGSCGDPARIRIEISLRQYAKGHELTGGMRAFVGQLVTRQAGGIN